MKHEFDKIFPHTDLQIALRDFLKEMENADVTNAMQGRIFQVINQMMLADHHMQLAQRELSGR